MPTRYKDYQEVEMAGGDAQPTWLLPDSKPRFVDWSFGGGRPFNCAAGSCDRWHAGIDCIGAKDGDKVIATEAGTIVGLDRGWSKGSKAVFVRTNTGLFLVYGGTKKGSGDEWNVREGMEVAKGQALGRVLGSYGMIHFETYTDSVRTANSRWYVGEQPPVGLLNPLNYLQRASGQEATLQTWSQIRDALQKLRLNPAASGKWGPQDTSALIEAQAQLDVDPDGIWGPVTELRIREELRRLGHGGPKRPADVPVPSHPHTSGPTALVPAALVAAGVGLVMFARRGR